MKKTFTFLLCAVCLALILQLNFLSDQHFSAANSTPDPKQSLILLKLLY